MSILALIGVRKENVKLLIVYLLYTIVRFALCFSDVCHGICFSFSKVFFLVTAIVTITLIMVVQKKRVCQNDEEPSSDEAHQTQSTSMTTINSPDSIASISSGSWLDDSGFVNSASYSSSFESNLTSHPFVLIVPRSQVYLDWYFDRYLRVRPDDSLGYLNQPSSTASPSDPPPAYQPPPDYHSVMNDSEKSPSPNRFVKK